MTIPENVEKQKPDARAPSMTIRLKMSDEDILKKYSFPHSPPPVGSEEEGLLKGALANQRIRQAALSRKATDEDLEAVLKDGGSIDAGERYKLALGIHKQLKKNKRRSRVIFWTGWLLFLSLLGGLGFVGYVYAMNNIHSERYSIPYSCKFAYGDGELEAHRTLSLPVKSLSGWRWTPPWSIVDERVEITLKGDPIVFVGVDNKGKTWRKEFSKGEFGSAILPNSQSYWIIGKNVKETTVIQHADFCK